MRGKVDESAQSLLLKQSALDPEIERMKLLRSKWFQRNLEAPLFEFFKVHRRSMKSSAVPKNEKWRDVPPQGKLPFYQFEKPALLAVFSFVLIEEGQLTLVKPLKPFVPFHRLQSAFAGKSGKIDA